MKWKTIVEMPRILKNDATVTDAECIIAVKTARTIGCLARTRTMCFHLDDSSKTPKKRPDQEMG